MHEYDVTVVQPLAMHHHVAASSKAEARRIIKALIEQDEHDPRIIESFPGGWAGAERIVGVDQIVWGGKSRVPTNTDAEEMSP